MMAYGYAGSILRVDLTEEKIRKELLPQELVEKFIGGWGINNRLFYDLQKPNLDPFSPQNPIILGVGPLVGTIVPGASKIVGTTKSPIADKEGKHFIDNAVAGSSRFGLMFKNAGYDHLVVTGKARKPVYLKIIDDDIEICDATTLWGKKDTYQTTDLFIDKYGSCGVISIGKAGENLVRYAMTIVDYCATLGRFGFGAIMGSKNLKAIIVKGTKGVKIAKPEEFLRLTNEWRKDAAEIPNFVDFRDGGFPPWEVQAPLVREGVWEYSRWTKLHGPQEWLNVKKMQNLACSSCTLSCRVSYEVKDGEFKGLTSFTGFYLLPARVGQRLEIEDYRKAVKLLDICNRAGMCYFTTSNLVNWVTRLYENGFLSQNETEGLELRRNFDIYIDLFNKVAKREGFGNLLADGWYSVSEKIGADPDEFTEGTGIFKGADIIQDARFTRLHPQGFTHLTNPRPHHGGTQSLYTLPNMNIDSLREDARKMGISEEELERIFVYKPEYGMFNVARYAKHCEDHMAVHNSLGTCVVHALWGWSGLKYLNIESIAQIYSAATGIEVDARELKKRGERAFNLFKLLNVREGFSRKDDKCSRIWLTPRKTPDGVRALMDYYEEKQFSKNDIAKLLDDYYDERGWELEDGNPKKQKLAELGLSGIIKELN
jgi:aldehyde:ferredoxin oxidoreductase